MSEIPPKIPPVEREKPQQSRDDPLEQDTLDKQAKSAAYRDALERTQHLNSLNRRIDVLQSKLDDREREVRRLSPRNAVLEQSSQVSKVLVRDGTFIIAIGGGTISAAGLAIGEPVRFVLAGLGGGLIICGLWICKLLNRNVWPHPEEVVNRDCKP